MKPTTIKMLLAAGAISWALPAHAATPLLQAGDTIIGINVDPSGSNSSTPGSGNENAQFALDGDPGTKYLNFGNIGAGLIVTPGSSTVQSFTITTANDSPDRDPTSYEIYGTNDAIATANNGDGLGESWTLIGSGSISLPGDRQTVGSPVNLTNSTAFSSYKIVFPTLNGTTFNSMQIADIQLYDGLDGTGTGILSFSNPVVAIDQPGFPESRFPSGENPTLILDGATGTKYLNFAGVGTGFIVEPSILGTTATGFEVWTANDAPGRDPSSYEIYGALGSILSAENSFGDAEAWTLIASGSLTLPDDREVSSGIIGFANTDAYDIYRVVFPDQKDPNTIFQISEFQLYSGVIPEPSTALIAALGLGFLGFRRRRS